MKIFRYGKWIRLGLFVLTVLFLSWTFAQSGLGSDSPRFLTAHQPAKLYAQNSYPQTTSDGDGEQLPPIPVEAGSSPADALSGESVPPVRTIELVSSLPDNQSVDVPVTSRIELEFSDAILDEDLEELELSIEPELSLQFNVADNRLVLQPSDMLQFSTEYTVTLAPQAALPLADEVQFSFKTEPQYTYDIDVQPLLHVSCVGCHGGFEASRSSFLDTYSGVLSVVEPGDESSLLIDPRYTQPHARRRAASQSLAQRFMRSNGYSMEKLGSWSPEEIEIVTTWVVQDEAVETSAARRARWEQGL